MSESTAVRVKNKSRFTVVPDKVLEDKRLSPMARLVAAWLHGRGDGFIVRVEAMRRMLGLTEFVWGRIRKELEAVGWWQSSRKRGRGGVFEWEHTFEFIENTIPKGTIPELAGDGSAMDGKLGDNQKDKPLGMDQEEWIKKEI